MLIACFDLEGVFTPEAWIAVAEATGIPDLRRTTRDVPDYDELMRYRLKILDAHGLTLPRLQGIIAGLDPLPGARAFLDWARERCPVVILSDTYNEFADGFMAKVARPMLFCHTLEVDGDGRITGYKLRLKDSKRRAILAFRDLGFSTLAVGDSYNDITMLREADRGIFFRAPALVKRDFPQHPAVESYADLQAEMEKLL